MPRTVPMWFLSLSKDADEMPQVPPAASCQGSVTLVWKSLSWCSEGASCSLSVTMKWCRNRSSSGLCTDHHISWSSAGFCSGLSLSILGLFLQVGCKLLHISLVSAPWYPCNSFTFQELSTGTRPMAPETSAPSWAKPPRDKNSVKGIQPN